jgi:hypothetical protein
MEATMKAIVYEKRSKVLALRGAAKPEPKEDGDFGTAAAVPMAAVTALHPARELQPAVTFSPGALLSSPVSPILDGKGDFRHDTIAI